MRNTHFSPSLARTYGYTAARRRALLQLIGFTDADHAHAARLQREVLMPDADRIVTDFYCKLGGDRAFRRVMARGFGIGHLHDAQRQYLLTLGVGFDTAGYVESRLRIGAAHARVPVPPWLYLGAYALLQRLILQRIRVRLRSATRRQTALVDFLVKIATLDMTLAIETYHNARLGELETSIKTLRGRAAQLHRRTELDAFTGVAHHARILDVLKREIASRGDRPVSIVMVDLDRFKSINDTYGHPAGDKALQAVAARLRAVARRDDVVGRYGGDEFVVVLKHASLATARRIAERLREGVGREAVDIGGRRMRVTLSAGVAVTANGEDAESLLARADAALYQAKHAGRNRVVAAGRARGHSADRLIQVKAAMRCR
ncbi:MAG: diguanylate cyclase [Gammaproteobacteria bacterium]